MASLLSKSMPGRSQTSISHKNVARLRVIQIIEATLGGAGRHVLDILEAGSACWLIDLHLLHSLRRADATYCRRIARLPCTVTQRTAPMQREIHPHRDLAALLNIVAYLRRHGPFDVVHLHSSKAGALGSFAGRLTGARRIVFTPNAFASAGAQGKQRQLYLSLERLCGRLAHVVVAVSPEEYDYALNLGIAPASRLRMIPNSIKLPDLANAPANRTRLRDAWGVAPHTRLIGSVGRLTAQKDPLLFIELASRRARRYSADEESYLVVGDGELASQLRERITACELRDRVIMAGFRTDVDAVLDSLDVFVLHSRYEGMPYTILEAMGHALPIITTRVAGVADPLRDGGLIVEIGDVAGLDAALDHQVNSERRRELGTANRSRLEQHFSLEKMIAALLEIYCG